MPYPKGLIEQLREEMETTKSEWWWTMWATRNTFGEDYNVADTLRKIVAESERKTWEEARKLLCERGVITSGKIERRKPGHGNCCTCQTCGYPHDECCCTSNEINAAIDAKIRSTQIEMSEGRGKRMDTQNK